MIRAMRSGLRWTLALGLCAGLCSTAPAAEKKTEKSKAAAEKAKKEEQKKKNAAAAKRQQAAAARAAASAKAINPSTGTAVAAEKSLKQKQDEKQKQIDAQYAKQTAVSDPKKLALALQRGGLSAEAIKRLDVRLRLIGTLQRNVLKDERIQAAELTAIRSEVALVAAAVAEGLTKEDGSPAPALLQKDWLRKTLQDGPLDVSDATELFRNLTRLLQVKNRLATEVMAPEARQPLLREMNSLLNMYFEAG